MMEGNNEIIHIAKSNLLILLTEKKQAGRKEVVEFTKDYWNGEIIWESPDGKDKLKEWGIK